MTEKPSLLFVCTLNAIRSPLAEALAREHYGDRYHVYSCGLSPSHTDEGVCKALQKRGIKYVHTPKHFEDLRGIKFEKVIVLSSEAREKAKIFADSIGALFFYWPIELPGSLIYSGDTIKETQLGYEILIEKIENKLMHTLG